MLKNANIGLTIVQSKDGGKYHAVKTQRIRESVSDGDWVQHLRKVVEPIRKEIFAIHDEEKTAMSDLTIDPPQLPYNKLRVLLTFLCHGKPEFRDISLPMDTLCQQVILNKKTTRDALRIKPLDILETKSATAFSTIH